MAKRTTYPSVKAYLKATNRTQESLADQLGISYPTMSRIVRGMVMPRPTLALRISEVTGVSVESLVRASADAAA
jgi:transcriptional regulator with XRE-family HTH domain